MKKRDWAIMGGLIGVLVIVLVAGDIHSRNLQNQQIQALAGYNNQLDNTMSATDSNRSPDANATNGAGGAGGITADNIMSAIDALKSAQKQNGTATLVAIGSSGTKGVGVSRLDETWFHLLTSQLTQQEGIKKLASYNLGASGASSNTLVNSSMMSQAITDKPDVILVETCAINDWVQNIPIQTSLSNLDKTVDQLQAALPKSQVIVFSANPVRADGKNALGVLYADYVTQEGSHFKESNVPYIDVYNNMQAIIKKGTYTTDGLLSDPYHANAQGNILWYQSILAGLKVKRTVVSGG